MKLEFFGQIFEKCSNIKSHENPSSGSRVVPCGRKTGKTALFWFWALEDGTISCPETSVRNYQCWLRNSPGERSFRLHRGGSLKLRRDDEANSRTSQFGECAWKMHLNFRFWFIVPRSNGWRSCCVFGCPAFMTGHGDTFTLRLCMEFLIFLVHCQYSKQTYLETGQSCFLPYSFHSSDTHYVTCSVEVAVSNYHESVVSLIQISWHTDSPS